MMRMMVLTVAAALSAASAAPASPPPAPVPVPAEASTLALPAATLPYSGFASAEARAAFAAMLGDNAARPAPPPGDIKAARAFYQVYNDARLAEVKRRYPADIRHRTMGGVTVDDVTPPGGPAPANAARVLLNLHGGAFMWGSGSGALVEAIPIAAVGRIRVVTVDYRMAPEHRYPAASEDVAAVYRALLAEYRPENIGIYGCSAGGVLTAQAVSWFLDHGLPRPGAIGTFCGTGMPFGGDSATLGQLATGQTPMPPPAGRDVLSYLADARADDPVAYPGISPATLAKFPPTLLLAGGRDFAVSALTTMQRRLLAAGVAADLVLFDGLWHAFFVYPDLPESQEAYAIIARFFNRHLGRTAR